MKKILRKKIKNDLQNIPQSLILECSHKICEKIYEFIIKNELIHIGLFLPIQSEPNLKKFLLLKKITCYAPVYDEVKDNYNYSIINHENDLIKGKYGILEPKDDPISLNDIEIILIPGIAFDVLGNRLGRGNGYYDNILKKYKGIKLGVCYENQILPNIPSLSHDQKMDYICTEKKTF